MPAVRRSLRSTTPTTRPVNVGQLKYADGPLQSNEIRIIEFNRNAANGTRLSVTLIRRDLNVASRYIALSYAWGDTSYTKALRVNDQDVEVSASLHDALHAIAASKAGHEQILVWADALCINQSNLEERNRQVLLMTSIYQNAQSVAIWLGARRKDDELAQTFLQDLHLSDDPKLVLYKAERKTLFAVASLFSRPYWSRIWVMQEIYNARNVDVYYGPFVDPWSVFEHASSVFQSKMGKRLVDLLLPRDMDRKSLPWDVSSDHLSHSQILMYHGPGAFVGVLGSKAEDEGGQGRYRTEHEMFQRLLEVMRLSRKKKTTDFRDRVFAILGVLPEEIRDRIKVDYSASLRDIYTDVFELVVTGTGRLDILCESIHFPLYRKAVELPSWLPDWSHIPMVSSLAAQYPGSFQADGGTRARASLWAPTLFCESSQRKRIFIQGKVLGSIRVLGIALNTGCRANDYIRAFEGWRLELMNHFRPASADTEDVSAWEGKDEERRAWISKEEEFCRTISCGKVGRAESYPLFAALIHSRFPYQPLDGELRRHAEQKGWASRADRQFLQDNFAETMMGRCFCVTREGDLGLGSGSMWHDDLVVVALGCCTPIILRSQGPAEDGKTIHRFVGDMYLHGYMNGEAFLGKKSKSRKWCDFWIE